MVRLARLAVSVAQDRVLERFLVSLESERDDNDAEPLTVNFCFSTNAFCLSTASEDTPTISTWVLLNSSLSASASRNWHASFVQPYEPAAESQEQ